MLDMEFPLEKPSIDMPSLNHSYLCSRILRQLFEDDSIEALTELTLDIDNGLTPDICVYPANLINPNFSRDITKLSLLPTLAIEVISASQNIQEILEKSERMIQAGIPAVWTVEPYTRTIFITTAQGEQICYNQPVESEGVKVDFKTIFQ
jgi:Uma2 family endonuclease